jgi:hypothetical protein
MSRFWPELETPLVPASSDLFAGLTQNLQFVALLIDFSQTRATPKVGGQRCPVIGATTIICRDLSSNVFGRQPS